MIRVRALGYLRDLDPNALRLIRSIMFLSFLTMGISGVTGILFILRLGMGTEFLGLFNSFGALGHLSIPLPASLLARRIGLKRAMYLGISLAWLGFLLIATVEYLPRSVWTPYLLASQFVTSAGFSTFLVNCTPAVMAATVNRNRTKTYGLYSAARNLGSLAGMLTGGALPAVLAAYLGLTLDLPAPFRWALILSTLSALLSIAALTRYQESQEVQVSNLARDWSTFPWLPVAMSLATVVLSQGAVAACYSFCNAYMDIQLQLSPQFIGALGALGQFCAVLMPFTISWMRKRLGNAAIMGLVSLGAALMLVPLIAGNHWLGAGLARTGIMSMAAIWMPVAQMYQMELVSSAWRTTAYAGFSMSLSVNYGIVSLLGGRIVGAWGFSALFLISCLISLVGCLVLAIVIGRPVMRPQFAGPGSGAP